MSEDKVIIDGKNLSYSGLISIGGLFRTLMKQLDEMGYNPYEEEHSEEVHEDGKQIKLLIKGDNKISDFAKIVWESSITISQASEVSVQKGHQKAKMHKGSINVNSLIILSTDYDKSYEQNAWVYFLRVLIDKFVFKSYVNRAVSRTKKDYAQFENHLKSFLNLETFR